MGIILQIEERQERHMAERICNKCGSKHIVFRHFLWTEQPEDIVDGEESMGTQFYMRDAL